jgi:hypothetical protein
MLKVYYKKGGSVEKKADKSKGPEIKKFELKGLFNKSSIYILGLALIVIVLFASFLFSGDKMLFGSDTMGGLDAKVFYKTSLDNHQFPLWFNTRLSGMPTIDAMFGDAFYPPSIAFFSTMPVFRALGLRLVFHVFLAGLFFFFLLRKGFKTSPFVAFLGAVFYMLNPEFVSHVYPGHDGKMFVIAWLPFVFWMLKSLLDKPKLLTASFLALGIAICLYTSHVQMSYFVLWGLFLYWLLFTILKYFKDRKISAIMPTAVYFWGAVILGLGLALMQLLPSYMFIKDAFSVRGVERGFDYAASWSLHWPEAISMWVPEFVNTLNNYWGENPFKLNSEYAGAMITLFAVVAVFQKAKPWRIFWAAICGLSLLFSLGAHTPVFHIAYYIIPGVKKFRACSMIMFWFSFGAAILSSLFFKDLLAGEFYNFSEKRKKTWKKGIYITVAAMTAAALLFSIQGAVTSLLQPVCQSLSDSQKSKVFEANFTKNFVPYLWLWWFFAVSAMTLFLGVMTGKVNKYVFCTVVLVIGLIDTLRIDTQFIQVTSPTPYFYSEQAIVDLKSKMAEAPFRCFSLPGALAQSGEGIHGLEGVGGFHDNELRWYREFRGDQQDRNYFDKIVGTMADGRPYLIPENLKNGNAFLNLANAQYYLIRQGEQLLTIKNEGALGRISFAPGYVVLDSSQIIDALHTGAYDIRKSVALMKEPDQKPLTQKSVDSLLSPDKLLTVRWEKYTPNFRMAAVSVKQDGFLRISEVYYPGWEIRIDKKPVKIYRSDLSWMAVNISSGDHVVEMIPHSLYLKKAAMVSFPLMILLMMYWVFEGLKRARKKKI